MFSNKSTSVRHGTAVFRRAAALRAAALLTLAVVAGLLWSTPASSVLAQSQEPGPTSNQSSYEFTVKEWVPVGTFVGVVSPTRSSDVNPSYWISKTPYFQIDNPWDGRITTSEVLLASRGPQVVTVDVIYYDNVTDHVTVTINVEANTAPVVTEQSVTVNEHAAVGAEIGVPAGSDADSDTLTYSLSPVHDADTALLEYLTIDSSTGVVTVKKRLDHETIDEAGLSRPNVSFLDLVFGAVYLQYRITVEDGRTGRATGQLTVVVKDLEGIPEFTTQRRTDAVAETVPDEQVQINGAQTSSVGDKVGSRVQAYHSEQSRLTYSLSGADAGEFSIDRSNGQITIAKALDHEAKAVYKLTVTATDSDGDTDKLEVTVNVTDVNERVYFQDKRVRQKSEADGLTVNLWDAVHAVQDFQPGEKVGKPLTAVDPDGKTITYSLHSDSSPGFRVDAATGQVYVKDNLRRDNQNPSNNIKHLVALAEVAGEGTDSKGPTNGYMTVTVGMPNHGPNSVAYLDALRRSVNEDAPVGSNIGAPIVTTDPDGDDITYSMHPVQKNEAAKRFSITDDGQLQVGKPLSFVEMAGFEGSEAPNTPAVHLDWNWIHLGKRTSNSVPIVVYARATDTRGGSSTIVLAVTVNYVGRAPVFSHSSVHREVTEDSAVGDTVGEPVVATDPNSETLTYSLSGQDAAGFSIEPSAGQLTVAVAMDHETSPALVVNVTATDPRGKAATVPVNITVTDVNEPPAFAADTVNLEVRNDSIVDVLIGDPVAAVDPDEGDTTTYSMTGTANAASFIGIKPNNGQLFVKAELDPYDDIDQYEVEVKAWDADGLYDTVAVTITEKESVATVPIAPGVQVTRLSGPGPTATGPFNVLVEFGGQFTGLAADDLELEGPITAADIGTPKPVTPGDNSFWIVPVDPKISGVVAFTLPAGAAVNQDKVLSNASNRLEVRIEVASADYSTVTLEHYGPDLVMAPFDLYATFDRPVNVDTSNQRIVDSGPIPHVEYEGIEVTNAHVSVINIRPWGGPEEPYTFRHYVLRVVPYTDGVVSVRLGSGTFGKVAPAEYHVTSELYRPAAVIKGPDGPVQGDFKVTVRFNKDHIDPLQKSGLEVKNGTVSRVKKLGSGNNKFRVTITPKGAGNVTVTVKEGATRMTSYTQHWLDEIKEEVTRGNFRSATYSVMVNR